MWYISDSFIVLYLINLCGSKFINESGYVAHLSDKRSHDLFVTGGRDIEITEVPWQVALVIDKRGYYSYLCGGSVLSDIFILTAAHCLEKYHRKKLAVRIGSQYRHKGGLIHDIKRILIHMEYFKKTPDYDIGIVELKKPINFGHNVQPISITDKEPEDGDVAVLSGYGRTKNVGHTPNHLKSANVAILGRNLCNEHYDQYGIRISPRMICAYSEGMSVNKGDSGGPLVVNGLLAGVVSWTVSYKMMENPSIHVNLANDEIRNFIREETGL